jgi:hypothetical protein
LKRDTQKPAELLLGIGVQYSTLDTALCEFLNVIISEDGSEVKSLPSRERGLKHHGKELLGFAIS